MMEFRNQVSRSVVESQGKKLPSRACVYVVSSRKLSLNNVVIKLDDRLGFILRHFQATFNSTASHPLVGLEVEQLCCSLCCPCPVLLGTSFCCHTLIPVSLPSSPYSSFGCGTIPLSSLLCPRLRGELIHSALLWGLGAEAGNFSKPEKTFLVRGLVWKVPVPGLWSCVGFVTWHWELPVQPSTSSWG